MFFAKRNVRPLQRPGTQFCDSIEMRSKQLTKKQMVLPSTTPVPHARQTGTTESPQAAPCAAPPAAPQPVWQIGPVAKHLKAGSWLSLWGMGWDQRRCSLLNQAHCQAGTAGHCISIYPWNKSRAAQLAALVSDVRQQLSFRAVKQQTIWSWTG